MAQLNLEIVLDFPRRVQQPFCLVPRQIRQNRLPHLGMIGIQQLLIILIQIPCIHRVQIERHHRQVVEMQETTIRIRFALTDDRQVFVADTELALQIEAGFVARHHAGFQRDGSAAPVDALRAFVQRQTKSRLTPDGISAPEFLDGPQANRVIEGLKAWLAREKHKAGEA